MTQMKLSTKQNRLTDIENRLVVAKGEGFGEGVDRKAGVIRRKLLYRMDKQQGPTV